MSNAMDRKQKREQERQQAKERKRIAKDMARQLVEGGYYIDIVDGKPKLMKG